MSGIWDDLWEERQRRLADKREWREGLAEVEARLDRLEEALTAIIRALALGETALTPAPSAHSHSLAGRAARQHLARAADTLGLDLTELGLVLQIPLWKETENE